MTGIGACIDLKRGFTHVGPAVESNQHKGSPLREQHVYSTGWLTSIYKSDLN
jgi:hypothetical protein